MYTYLTPSKSKSSFDRFSLVDPTSITEGNPAFSARDLFCSKTKQGPTSLWDLGWSPIGYHTQRVFTGLFSLYKMQPSNKFQSER